jgi:hypothetical protein
MKNNQAFGVLPIDAIEGDYVWFRTMSSTFI